MIRKAPSPVPFEGGLECRPEDRAAPALVIEPTGSKAAETIRAGRRSMTAVPRKRTCADAGSAISRPATVESRYNVLGATQRKENNHARDVWVRRA
jgi:hypothetical protein